MNKKYTVLIVILVVASIGAFGYAFKNESAPTTVPPVISNAAAVGNTVSQAVEIDMLANSFSPSTVTIHSGDTVNFINKDTAPHWPASDPHPSHTGYPGFDALRPIAPGQNYSFQFILIGSFGFHDHLNPAAGGRVIVLSSQASASSTSGSTTVAQPAPIKVGAVTWHQKNFIGKEVNLVGYVLKIEKGYVIFSDEATGAITAHDLPVSGTGTDSLVLRHKYDFKGIFLDKGLVASNGSKYHLELSETPVPTK